MFRCYLFSKLNGCNIFKNCSEVTLHSEKLNLLFDIIKIELVQNLIFKLASVTKVLHEDENVVNGNRNS